MRPLLGVIFLASLLQAEWSTKGYVGVDVQVYPTIPTGKNRSNFTLQQKLEVGYEYDDFEAALNLYAQEDSSDLSTDSEKQNKRSFIRLDEIYGKYNFENDMVFAGKNIRFWGALEVNNLVDTFNTHDFRTDGLDPQKQGAWNVAFTHYFENSEFSMIVKLHEEEEEMAAYPYAYYFFPKEIVQTILVAPPVNSVKVVTAISYESELYSQESLYRPTLYLSYSGSTDSDYPLDYAVVFQHGFDGQRVFNADLETIDSLNYELTFSQEAYLVNKLMSYNTLVVDAALFKFEGQVVKLVDDNVTSSTISDNGDQGFKKIGDYYQFGVGVEYTLTALLEDGDLGLISECYYYDTFRHSDVIATDLNLFQVFQNDLFLGFRYTFNDSSDSSIIVGAIVDMEYEEQSFSFKYETRIFDVLKMKFDYVYINPSSTDTTAYALMGFDEENPEVPVAHQRLGINLAYHF